MQKPAILVLAATLVTTCAAPAYADGFLTPFAGFNFGGDSTNCASLTSCDDKRVNWGVAVGTTSGIFGFELEFADAPNFFGSSSGDNAVLTLTGSLMLVIPAGPVQPYGVVGLGLVRPHGQLNASSLASDQNTLGWDIGGGVNIFFARHVGVRGDVRHLRTLQDITLGGFFANAPLDFWRGTAGLTLRF